MEFLGVKSRERCMVKRFQVEKLRIILNNTKSPGSDRNKKGEFYDQGRNDQGNFG